MFGFGNSKKSRQKKYQQLEQKSFDMSTVNRKKRASKLAGAEEIGKQIDDLEKNA